MIVEEFEIEEEKYDQPLKPTTNKKKKKHHQKKSVELFKQSNSGSKLQTFKGLQKKTNDIFVFPD